MTARLTIGSLFSGIGGLELGLEWAGLGPVVWQVEQDDYCRRVLAKHWPDATRFEDVRDVGAANLQTVDVICGGFPCQDISVAGKGAGLAGARSGLWIEYARIVRELRPCYVVVENVTALLDRGFGDVLGTLAESGYDAEWSELSACAVGAAHARRRVFILAYSDSVGRRVRTRPAARLHERAQLRKPERADDRRAWATAHGAASGNADGLPGELDRLRVLGNAVVPQVAEIVGRLILEREASARGAA